MARAGSVEDIVNLVTGTHREGGRTLVGIAGAPGSGKSTIADELVGLLQGRHGAAYAALLPMDGFHLDNAELDARGLRSVKGAPDTFDVAGFLALVRKVREGRSPISYPLFDRALDRTLPDAGHLGAETSIVVFEGNYLLLKRSQWVELKPLFDVTVMLSVPPEVLRQRLIDRWLSYGLSPAEATARAEGNDMANARTILENSAEADLILEPPRTDRIDGDGPTTKKERDAC